MAHVLKVKDGSHHALKHNHGRFLAVEHDHQKVVHGNNEHVHHDERFQVVNISRPGKAVRVGDKVAFKTAHGKYVSAQPDGRLEADRDEVKEWEHFTVVSDKEVGKKIRPTEDAVSFKTHFGKYVCVEPDFKVVANREKVDKWEQFHFH